MEIKLGDKVKDSVTGFEGTVVARVEYLNGCVQFCVKPKMGEDGKLPNGEYIDAGQLRVIVGAIAEPLSEGTAGKPGGEYIPDCPKH